MEEDWHEQSEQSFDRAKFYKHDCGILILNVISFFQENKSYGIKTHLH
jgi:hypothetical protein